LTLCQLGDKKDIRPAENGQLYPKIFSFGTFERKNQGGNQMTQVVVSTLPGKSCNFFLNFPAPGKSWKMSVVWQIPAN